MTLLNKLDTIVLPAITIEIIPAVPNDACRSVLITGHADPSNESGKPKLINAKYIIIRKKVAIGICAP